ncbi:hypothetical protein [Alteromonas aestuariivivens]|nr:hypothetical protein [Alteromonas aestuariivivens]
MYKHKPLVFAALFSLTGLLLAGLLSFIRFLFEDGVISDAFNRLEGVAFLAIVSIALGLLASEINFFIKSDILSSVLFGICAPLVFIGMLLLDSLLFDGTIKSMHVEFYLAIYALGSLLSGGVFYGTLRKNT